MRPLEASLDLNLTILKIVCFLFGNTTRGSHRDRLTTIWAAAQRQAKLLPREDLLVVLGVMGDRLKDHLALLRLISNKALSFVPPIDTDGFQPIASPPRQAVDCPETPGCRRIRSSGVIPARARGQDSPDEQAYGSAPASVERRRPPRRVVRPPAPQARSRQSRSQDRPSLLCVRRANPRVQSGCASE
jgi:hypothetical protein